MEVDLLVKMTVITRVLAIIEYMNNLVRAEVHSLSLLTMLKKITRKRKTHSLISSIRLFTPSSKGLTVNKMNKYQHWNNIIPVIMMIGLCLKREIIQIIRRYLRRSSKGV